MILILQVLLCSILVVNCDESVEVDSEKVYKWPTVGISVLVRDQAHTLPYFLSCVRKLEYPKDRIHIWIYTDNNEDKSLEIVEGWSARYGHQYHGVEVVANGTRVPREPGDYWDARHFAHVIALRERALHAARRLWADYLFMLDADVYITNPELLKILINKDYPVVAPMLFSDGLYSNFWCGMTDSFYYKRTEDYKPMLNREKTGCFEVAMIHTAVLMDLRQQAADHFTYNPANLHDYNGPVDDIIAFAFSCKNNGIPLMLCNDEEYGFLQVPLEDNQEPSEDIVQLINIKMEAISHGTPIPVDVLLEQYVEYPRPGKLGLDEVYVINLERRPERRALMHHSFRELGMDVKWAKAVDGRNIDMNDLKQYSVTLMPNYEDPYHKRPMTGGEVGCFLSHYYIWEEMVAKGHETALVLEDDVRFVPYFRQRLRDLMEEVADLDWDFLYVGRKSMSTSPESPVSAHAVSARYSYWTLAYVLRARGAARLLRAAPREKLLPVDEFLPIMFDHHPNSTWKSQFPGAKLTAIAAEPPLVQPTHYTGQPGYVSDTEHSPVLHNEL